MKIWDRLFGQSNPVEELQAEAALGDMFQVWASTDIGRYIVGKAEQYELEVLQKLSTTNPEDVIAIIQLQAESKIPGKLLSWISEAIEAGEVAKFQLSELEGD